MGRAPVTNNQWTGTRYSSQDSASVDVGNLMPYRPRYEAYGRYGEDADIISLSQTQVYTIGSLLILLFILNLTFLCSFVCRQRRVNRTKYSKVHQIYPSDEEAMEKLKEIAI